VYTEPDGKQEASVQAKRLDFGLMLVPTIFRRSTSSQAALPPPEDAVAHRRLL
jgi:hypothetical protein